MASDNLKAKWRLWFYACDANLDGVLSDADIEACGNTFCELHHLEGDKAMQARDIIASWFKTFLFRENAGREKISEEVFLETLNKDYAADKMKFKQDIVKCINLLFDLLDNDKDTFVSKEEFEIALRMFKIGSLEPDFIGAMFDSYSPEGERVPVQDMVDSWVTLITNEDPTQRELIRDAVLQKQS